VPLQRMFRSLLTLALLISFSCGCKTHQSLRHHTNQTVATIADLHYQQVLDNTARFACIHSSLPSFAVVNNGTVTVMDQATLGAAGTYAPTITQADQIGGFPIFSLFANPNVARGITENWTMEPVTENGRLRRLRAAFQYLVVGELGIDQPDDFEAMKRVLGLEADSDYESLLPRGWYCEGTQKQVPKDAAWTGAYRDRFVWVMPWGMESCSRFTMTALQLASQDEPKPPSITVTQRFNASQQLLETEITESDAEATDDEPSNAMSPIENAGTPPLRPIPRVPKNATLSPRLQRKRPGSGNGLIPRQ